MFDIEFRFVTLFGLAGALLAWMFVWIIGIIIRKSILNVTEKMHTITPEGQETYRKVEKLWGALLWPGMLMIIVGYLFLIMWVGWRAMPTSGEPQGVLEGPPQGTIQFKKSSNSPEVAGERIREEGLKIQTEGLQDLKDWRQEFFNKESDDEDELGDGDSDDGDADDDGRVRDSSPTGQEDHPDASER